MYQNNNLPNELNPRLGFRNYSSNEFTRLRWQVNIMVFVGNGFDIQVCKDLGLEKSTSYNDFYLYLHDRGKERSNVIYRYMNSRLNENCSPDMSLCWSNVERSIQDLIDLPIQDLPEGKRASQGELVESVNNIQYDFAEYINEIIPQDKVFELSKKSSENRLAIKSLSRFLEDIKDSSEFKKLSFVDKVYHHVLFNYHFVNFNYTTLLDNYIYLDRKQFDYKPYHGIDTNFRFYRDPYNLKTDDDQKGHSGYVMVNVSHPHGIITTPRSLVLGIDKENERKDKLYKQPFSRLQKLYESHADIKYKDYFKTADLFIMFGLSIGASDGWWWRKITRAITTPGSSAELIIYYYDEHAHTQAQSVQEEKKQAIRNHFLQMAGVDLASEEYPYLCKRIHIILYDDESKITFLQTAEHTA